MTRPKKERVRGLLKVGYFSSHPALQRLVESLRKSGLRGYRLEV